MGFTGSTYRTCRGPGSRRAIPRDRADSGSAGAGQPEGSHLTGCPGQPRPVHAMRRVKPEAQFSTQLWPCSEPGSESTVTRTTGIMILQRSSRTPTAADRLGRTTVQALGRRWDRGPGPA